MRDTISLINLQTCNSVSTIECTEIKPVKRVVVESSGGEM